MVATNDGHKKGMTLCRTDIHGASMIIVLFLILLVVVATV